MKYWIFQNNQVLGPYEPDDLSRHSAFSAESLVCPEGRRGTSMGDWQRAGMVPDLSLALVKAAQAHAVLSPVATLAGLPPEPTLKDLAVLGSLQEKMATLEEAVLQLQEGLRAKDAELTALHQELAGKERQAGEIKSAVQHEADELKAQTDAFKAQIAELEEKLSAVGRLTETVDKAVETEKSVQRDVESQAAAISDLTKEIEGLRAQLQERLAGGAPAGPSPFAPAKPSVPAPLPAPKEPAWGAPAAAPGAAAPLPELAPPPSIPPPVPEPGAVPFPGTESTQSFPAIAPATASVPPPPPTPTPSAAVPVPAAEPEHDAGSLPAFGAPPAPVMLDPLGGAGDAAAAPAPEAAAPVVDDVGQKAPGSSGSKKGVLVGVLLGLVVLGALAVYSGRLGGKKTAMPAAPVADTTPLPPPAPVAPVAPPPDPRQTAIDLAKNWPVKDDVTLGAELEKASPPAGNLSPWMAEPLPNDHAMVNYFAHASAPGAATVAYEFEVDLTAKTLIARNAAAKAALDGKAGAPPPPPAPKKVKVKAKSKPQPKPEESLDSLLGGDSNGQDPAIPGPKARPLSAPADDSAPPTNPVDAAPAPAKPAAKAGKRAARAAGKSAKSDDAGGKADDQALLDDLLKE